MIYFSHKKSPIKLTDYEKSLRIMLFFALLFLAPSNGFCEVIITDGEISVGNTEGIIFEENESSQTVRVKPKHNKDLSAEEAEEMNEKYNEYYKNNPPPVGIDINLPSVP